MEAANKIQDGCIDAADFLWQRAKAKRNEPLCRYRDSDWIADRAWCSAGLVLPP